jgi:hypothetical protein
LQSGNRRNRVPCTGNGLAAQRVGETCRPIQRRAALSRVRTRFKPVIPVSGYPHTGMLGITG